MRRTPREFESALNIVYYTGDTWLLDYPLYYGEVRVPKGFPTDLLSAPAPFRAFISPCGPGARAAVVHDYLLSRGVRWAVAAAYFREALRHSGISWARAWIAWAGVVLWGWMKHRR